MRLKWHNFIPCGVNGAISIVRAVKTERDTETVISMRCKWKLTFGKPCGVNGTIVFRAVETEQFL